MKKLISSTMLMLSALVLPNLASAETACLALSEIIPYSPYERLEAHCNGTRLEVTSLFGRNIEPKFNTHIGNFGYKSVASIGRNLVVSKQTREEIGVSEFCYVVKMQSREEFSFTCEESMGWSIRSNKEADLHNYLKSHQFKILNSPKRKTDPYVVGR